MNEFNCIRKPFYQAAGKQSRLPLCSEFFVVLLICARQVGSACQPPMSLGVGRSPEFTVPHTLPAIGGSVSVSASCYGSRHHHRLASTSLSTVFSSTSFLQNLEQDSHADSITARGDAIKAMKPATALITYIFAATSLARQPVAVELHNVQSPFIPPHIPTTPVEEGVLEFVRDSKT